MSTRTRRRPVVQAALAGLAAVLLAGACSSSGASETSGNVKSTKVTVAIPGPSELFNLPVILARELGFYEDEGLDVRLIDLKSGSAAVAAVLSGDANAASGFHGHTFNMAAKGQAVQSFVTTMNTIGMALSVPPGDRTIEDVADLKGATVGVSAPGSGSHMLLNFLLHQHELSPDDVSIAGIGLGATAVAAVEHGQVDAAVNVEPTLSRLQERVEGLRFLVDTRTKEGLAQVFGPGGAPSMSLYARSAWLDKHPDEARKMAVAVTQALAWIAAHDAAEIVDAMPPEFVAGDRALYVSSIETAKAMFSTDGRLTPAAAEAAHRMLSLSVPEVASADIDPADTYTNEFLPER